MYFLRRNNKTPQIRETSELSKEDEEEESKPYSLRSEYQEIKNLI